MKTMEPVSEVFGIGSFLVEFSSLFLNFLSLLLLLAYLLLDGLLLFTHFLSSSMLKSNFLSTSCFFSFCKT